MEKFTSLVESEPEDWWSIYETNIFGVYLLTRVFVPLLEASPNPDRTVLNISSIGALRAVLGSSAYSSSKFALLKLTDFINLEEGHKGILAYAMHPGGVATGMGRSMPDQYHSLLTVSRENLE